MKAMILVASPEECCNLLNGDLSLLVRKKFPSNYVGWVYIYVTNSRKHYLVNRYVGVDNTGVQDYPCGYETVSKKPSWSYNGKVIARFWCDKVEEIYNDSDEYYECYYQTNTLAMEDLCEQSCLDYNELNNYLCEKQGKAIPIIKLEIFDKQKEICDKLSEHGYEWVETSGENHDHCTMIWNDIATINLSIETDKIIISDKFHYWIGDKTQTDAFMDKLWSDLYPRLQRYWKYNKKLARDGQYQMIDRKGNVIEEGSKARRFIESYGKEAIQ